MILKNFTMGVALTLVMGAMVGCSDTVVDSTPSDDAVFAMRTVDQASMTDFSEVPTVDDVLAKGDPVRGRERDPRGDKGDRGWGNLETRPYQRILAQLRLSDEQSAAIRVCFADYRECTQSASTRYRAARTEKHETLKSGLARVRAAVEGGTMTREQAAEIIRTLTSTYREQIATMNEGFKAAIEACRVTLEECITGHLTREQLARWNRLKG